MKISVNSLLAFLLLVPALLSCALTDRLKDDIVGDKVKSDTSKVFTADDGSCQITVNQLWETEKQETKGIILLIADKKNGIVAAVSKKPASVIDEDTPFDEYAETVRDMMAAQFTSPQSTAIETVQVGGYQARRFELSGVERKEKTKFKYLVVQVLTPEAVFSINIWADPDDFEKHRETIQKIADSFKANAAAAAPANANSNSNTKKKPYFRQ